MSKDEEAIILGRRFRQYHEVFQSLKVVLDKLDEARKVFRQLTEVETENEFKEANLNWPSKDEVMLLLEDKKRLYKEFMELEQCLKDMGYANCVLRDSSLGAPSLLRS